MKRRRTELMCVICNGPSSGYNFNQITCHSCKEFFRRTALLPIEKTKCINQNPDLMNIRCEIRYNIQRKCQRCRLLKCFEIGMRKDHLITRDEKMLKQKRIEENIRNRENSVETKMNESILNDIDRNCLLNLSNSYINAVRSCASATSVYSFDPSLNKTYFYSHLTELDYLIAVKCIHFLRSIPEFESLIDKDRLGLVKSNLSLIMVVRDLLIFDREKGLFYDDYENNCLSPVNERYARYYLSLSTLFYGYEQFEFYISTIRRMINSVDNDPLVVKLLMVNLIFLKGVSINDEDSWILVYPESVFNAQMKYVDLLFRYLIDRYSSKIAIIQMMHLIENIFRIQIAARHYQSLVKKRSDDDGIHPLLKSLLSLT